MAKSLILDHTGNPMAVRKSTSAPNLDPGFFISGANNEASVAAVVSKPYKYHVWVHACVRAISQNISALTRVMKEKKGGSVNNESPILTLLAKPNKLMTMVPFFRTIVSNLLLPATCGNTSTGGQCFIIPWNTSKDDKVNLGRGEIPDELFPYGDQYFEPWYADVTKQGRKNLNGWKFRVGGTSANIIYFKHEEILRVNLLNPYDLLKGMSPYSPVAQAVELDAHADIYNQDSFANQGRIDGQVSTDQMVPEEELEHLEKEWYKKYTGPKAKRVAFLTGGLKYEQYALSSSDMQYLEQQKWTRQKTLAAYGLNRIAVGDYEDINFATIREGRKLLWYDTYIPLDKTILDAINGQWVDNVDKGRYCLASDYSKVPALQSDMNERITNGGKLVTQMSFPPSLAARITEIPISEDDLAKWPELDAIPVKPAAAPAAFMTESVERSVKPAAIKKDTRAEYSERYIMRVLEPAEKSFRKDLDRYFIDQRNKILDNVDAWAKKQKSAATKAAGVSAFTFLPDEVQEFLILEKMYMPNAKHQAELEKTQIESEMNKPIKWDVSTQRVQYWANARSVYLEDINTATFNVARDAIDATVKQGMADGITPKEMAKNIKQSVHTVYEVRQGRPADANGLFDLGGMSSSTTIARTEMGTIASLSRVDIFKEEGIKRIEWVTSRDNDVRDTHAALDGATTNLGEPFSNGLRFPRDPTSGDAGEIINCRCVMAMADEQEVDNG